jgi:hypothetical protein
MVFIPCTGADVFSNINPMAPVVIVLSCWAYAHHVASSLQTHQGPILLLANFDGAWPGLVALLKLIATCLHLGIPTRVAGAAKDALYED